MKTGPNYLAPGFGCDICGGKRSIGNHSKCAKKRQLKYQQESKSELQPPSNANQQ